MDTVTDDKHVIIEDQERPLVWVAKPKPTLHERRDKRELAASFLTDAEIDILDANDVPRCDICSEPWEDGGEGEDWNGETGNHVSCEEPRAEVIDEPAAEAWAQRISDGALRSLGRPSVPIPWIAEYANPIAQDESLKEDGWA